ncbi:nucleotidyltransferase family protein [Lactobacillus sp. UCMA15818]|mgnify:CR=1 FL=1|uniref:nucleotidyltransferase family protein n=1 Tax=Lactobacillaceae TaxID=33958 RepID=UPI0025B0A4B2|nr:nucleotidyltransferase family protein [Lactobacillus sp. UCMA15818]MDN2452829.1 nucleotidyltransferase family protein [Lactobacillus sp. UCMA15818]
MNYNQQLLETLAANTELAEIFEILKTEHLSTAFVCSGVLRTIIWNNLSSQKTNLVLENIDVLYANASESYEQFLTKKAIFSQKYSKYLWNLENICLNDAKSMQPFGKNIETALKNIPETCNSVAINLNTPESLIIAPFSLDHLFNFEIHPTPRFQSDKVLLEQFKKRVINKKWQAKWPTISFFVD